MGDRELATKKNQHTGRVHVPDYAIFYTEKHFPLSLTYNKWVPLCCDDIHFLLPFNVPYKQDPTLSRTPDGGPFFFYNHPINYVSIRGHCVEVQVKKLAEGRSQVIMVINDYSGRSVDAFKFTYSHDSFYYNMRNKFVRINGSLQLNKLTKEREVKICDICVAARNLKQELLLCDEAITLRREVLMKPWVVPDTERIPVIRNKSVVESDWKSLVYCSLHRYSSVLYDVDRKKRHPSFRLDTRRNRIGKDLSKLEDRTNELHRSIYQEKAVQYYELLTGSYRGTPAERFLEGMRILGVSYEDVEALAPVTDCSKHLALYKEFLLSICCKESLYGIEIDAKLIHFSTCISILCRAGSSYKDVRNFILNCEWELVHDGKMVDLNTKAPTFSPSSEEDKPIRQRVGEWNIGPLLRPLISAKLDEAKNMGISEYPVTLHFLHVEEAVRSVYPSVDREIIKSILLSMLGKDVMAIWGAIKGRDVYFIRKWKD